MPNFRAIPSELAWQQNLNEQPLGQGDPESSLLPLAFAHYIRFWLCYGNS